MSKNRSQSSTSGRRNFSILGISFAIAMAFFLVIGMIAVAIPTIISDNDQSSQGALNQNVGDEPSEEDELRETLEEDPDDVGSMILLADLLANTGRYNEAIRWYEQAIGHRPEQASLRIAFAEALNTAGYVLDSEVQLDRALELEPENVEAMYMLADIMERENPPRREEADELYQRITESAPESYYAELAQERLAGDGGEGTSGTEE